MPRTSPFRPSRLPILGIAAAFALGLSGCATAYKVQVNSMINPEIESGESYTLVSHDPSLPERDLNYSDVADRVRTALAAKGMIEAGKPTEADIVVDIEYGQRAPHTKVTTVQETQMVPADPLGLNVDPLSGRVSAPNTITLGGNNPSSRNYPGQNQYPGSGSGMQTVTTTTERVTEVSEKYIRLSARENVKPKDRNKKKAAQVWVVEAVVEDEKSDVHKVMPPLVTALTDYIGVSTSGKQTVTVSSDER